MSASPSSPSKQDQVAVTAARQTFDMVQLILKRRRHEEHSNAEIECLISEFTSDKIPSYQMAAWLMAVCCSGDAGRGLNARETATLTRCLVESGQQLDWSSAINASLRHNGNQPLLQQQDDSYFLMDKHSTGGVGDKVSLVLAPLLVACGQANVNDDSTLSLRVPMLAGRGLGHTGGTIDKLEAIPGFTTNLSATEFMNQVSNIGCCIACASSYLVCPADAKLYALRDVTGTVSNVALQTASIMSKKICERPQLLLLDCKYGNGSFQATKEEAEILAKSMIHTGVANGIVPTFALLTRMNEPLGCAVGNWLEVLECIDIMRGNFWKRRDLVTLIVMQAAYMMWQSKQFDETSVNDLALLAMDCLVSGKALTVFRKMVVAQGGDVSVVDDPTSYPMVAKYTASIFAKQDGYIAGINALTFGQVSVQLGAGRFLADEAVDPCAGIWLHCQVGDAIKRGDKLADVYTNRDGILIVAMERLEAAFTYSHVPVATPPIVSHVVFKDGTQEVTIPSALTECLQLFDQLEK
ncbi:hypothetical protein MPSEU_000327600 [Mayamaea pseudoterrestris]|nr:hypothetical protein MPSEU_000327600 [Mayamaea pseudoterrestris]